MDNINSMLCYSQNKNKDIYNFMLWCAKNSNSETARKVSQFLHNYTNSENESISSDFKKITAMSLQELFDCLTIYKEQNSIAIFMNYGYHICESCGRFSETIYEENNACVCPECAGQI